MKRFILIYILAFLPAGLCPSAAALANSAAIETESLMPAQRPSNARDAEGKPGHDEPLTPEAQALLICQTADIMSGTPAAGPDYKEGVDAYGRPVVPADGGADDQHFTIPDAIEVPIGIDVMQALGVNAPAGLKGEARFGTLKVLKGGRLFYNDGDITRSVEGFCRTHIQKTDKKS